MCACLLLCVQENIDCDFDLVTMRTFSHYQIMCGCLLLRVQENIDCDFDLVTMCTFNHYVCLSAIVFAGEH